MDAIRLLIAQYLRAAWRRRWMGVIIAWLVCGLGWVGVYAIPNQYESSARLYRRCRRRADPAAARHRR